MSNWKERFRKRWEADPKFEEAFREYNSVDGEEDFDEWNSEIMPEKVESFISQELLAMVESIREGLEKKQFLIQQGGAIDLDLGGLVKEEDLKLVLDQKTKEIKNEKGEV